MVTYFVDMLELALPMSAMIAILLLLSPLIKRSFIAKWRYYMWLFVALRLLIPVRLFTVKDPVVMEIPMSISGVPVTAEAAANTAVSVQDILMLIWVIGMVLFAAYHVISYLTFRARVKRWSENVCDMRILDAYIAARDALGLNSTPRIRLCKAVSTPMLFGFIRPVLLLPNGDYSDEELGVILRHELVHYKRHDILYKLILTAANCVYWFDPLVYLMAGAANRDIELACDADVVKGHDMEYRQGYCMAILNVVHNKRQRTAPLSTCFIISRRVIKERFKDILSFKKKRRGVLLFAVVALSVAVCGSVVTFATEKTADVLEEELQIIERPTPKPEPEPTTRPTSAPAAAPVQTRQPVTAVAPPRIVTPTAAPSPVPRATPAPVYVPIRDPETVKARVDLSTQSSRMNISFGGEGETYTSQSSFVAADDMNMVIVSGGDTEAAADEEFSLRIVNDTTGEVVHEEKVNANDSLLVPLKSGEYSVNATSAGEGESSVTLYVYGKDSAENGDQ